MARTTATEVKQIMDGCNITDTVVDEFITAANLTVTEILGSDTTLSTSQKAEIERWLTAHLISITKERLTTEEKLGEATVKYAQGGETQTYWIWYCF